MIFDNSGDLLTAMLSAHFYVVVAATLQRQKKRKTTEETAAKAPEPSEYRCLVRATDGKKKISCSVRCLILNTRLFFRLCIYMLNDCVFFPSSERLSQVLYTHCIRLRESFNNIGRNSWWVKVDL